MKTTGKYVMVDGKVVEENDLETWAMWFAAAHGDNIHVDLTFIGSTSISTVFLAIDHSFGSGKPVLWETMIFSEFERIDEHMDRYTSEADAQDGHNNTVIMVHLYFKTYTRIIDQIKRFSYAALFGTAVAITMLFI